MSAFIVDKAHIDALVSAAADVEHGKHNSGLTWYHKIGTDEGSWPELEHHEMSYSNHLRASEVGMMLWSENLASIEYRYPDTVNSGEYPGPLSFSRENISSYEYQARPGIFDPVAILKALSCYEYQTCEHPGWHTSEAHTFCEALRDKMIRNLPGYHEAKWEIAAT